MSWQYQLVVQFPLRDADIGRFETLADLETELEEWLINDSEVDGNDVGSGEMNIFVFTDNPLETLKLIQAFLQTRPAIGEYRVGYRRRGGDEYTPAWPPELHDFKVA